MPLSKANMRGFTRSLTRGLDQQVGEDVYMSETSDYFSRAETLGGSFDLTGVNATYTETYVKKSTDALVRYLNNKPNGLFGSYGGASSDIWGLLDEVYLLSGVTFSGFTAKLKYKSGGDAELTNTAFTASQYIAAGSSAGLKSTGNMYLTAGLTWADFDADSFSFFGYPTEFPTNNGGQGPLIAFKANTHELYQAAGQWFFEPDYDDIRGGTGIGFGVATKTSASACAGYANGSLVASQTPNQTDPASGTVMYMLCRGPASFLNNARTPLLGVGKGLTSDQVAYLSWCINAWATRIGFNTYNN